MSLTSVIKLFSLIDKGRILGYPPPFPFQMACIFHLSQRSHTRQQRNFVVPSCPKSITCRSRFQSFDPQTMSPTQLRSSSRLPLKTTTTKAVKTITRSSHHTPKFTSTNRAPINVEAPPLLSQLPHPKNPNLAPPQTPLSQPSIHTRTPCHRTRTPAGNVRPHPTPPSTTTPLPRPESPAKKPPRKNICRCISTLARSSMKGPMPLSAPMSAAFDGTVLPEYHTALWHGFDRNDVSMFMRMLKRRRGRRGRVCWR